MHSACNIDSSLIYLVNSQELNNLISIPAIKNDFKKSYIKCLVCY